MRSTGRSHEGDAAETEWALTGWPHVKVAASDGFDRHRTLPEEIFAPRAEHEEGARNDRLGAVRLKLRVSSAQRGPSAHHVVYQRYSLAAHSMPEYSRQRVRRPIETHCLAWHHALGEAELLSKGVRYELGEESPAEERSAYRGHIVRS